MSGYEDYLRDINDPVGILSCYKMFGAVGITNVLTTAECVETISDVENIMQKEFNNNEFCLSDQETHSIADSHLNAFGVIGKAPLFSNVLTRNRFHPNVQKAYSIVYELESDKLLAQYDRVSWMRPTITSTDDLRQYRMTPNIHLDIDPSSYFEPSLSRSVHDFLSEIPYSSTKDLTKENNAKCQSMGRQLQGVISLYDNADEDGGFCFTPGGHLSLEVWYQKFKKQLPTPTPNGRHIFRSTDREFKSAVRLPCPAGTLIIFDAALPHGTKPNYSDHNRMIQFLRYMPRSTLSEKSIAARRCLIERELRHIGYKPTANEKRVL